MKTRLPFKQKWHRVGGVWKLAVIKPLAPVLSETRLTSFWFPGLTPSFSAEVMEGSVVHLLEHRAPEKLSPVVYIPAFTAYWDVFRGEIPGAWEDFKEAHPFYSHDQIKSSVPGKPWQSVWPIRYFLNLTGKNDPESIQSSLKVISQKEGDHLIEAPESTNLPALPWQKWIQIMWNYIRFKCKWHSS